MGCGEIDITESKRLIEYSDTLYMLEQVYSHTKQVDEILLNDILNKYMRLAIYERDIGLDLLAKSIEYLGSNKLESEVVR